MLLGKETVISEIAQVVIRGAGMDLVFAAAAAFIAYTVKGLCGFGNTLVFASIMSFRADTVSITPVESVLGLAPSGYIAWKCRKEFEPGIVIPMALVMAAGSLAGTLVLKNASPGALKVLFGFVTIALAVEMLLRGKAGKREGSRKALMLIGILAGIMSGLYGVGALMAAYMSRTTRSANAFRGNLCAVFFINDTIRLILYLSLGILTGGVFRLALMLVPFMAAGVAAGSFLAGRISEEKVRLGVIVLLILSGVSLIAANI